MTKLTFGGIVNKTPGKNSFVSIMQMLKNDRCKITSVSYSSLKGFVFKLHIEPEKGKMYLDECDVEFYGLNCNKTAFDADVDTLILKLAILHKTEEIDLEPHYVSVSGDKKDKQADIYGDFLNEAVLQSYIYERTVSKGEPICPALVDFSHFSDLNASIPFLDVLASRCYENDDAKPMIDYLKSQLTSVHDIELGMIAMEIANDFISFYDTYDQSVGASDDYAAQTMLENGDPTPDQVKLCDEVMTQVLRLLNEARCVHCDLHGNNVMVKTYYDGSHKIYLIDFGRVLYIDGLSSEMATLVNKYTDNVFNEPPFFAIQDGKVSQLVPSIKPNNTVFTEEYVKNLTMLALSVDYAYNKFYFDWSESSKMNKNYVVNFNGNSMVNMTNALNIYYNLANFSGYKRLDATQNYNRSVADIEELVTCFRKKANAPVSLLKPTSSSPERIQFKAKAARSIQKEPKKKQRPLSEGELEEISSFPSINAFPSMDLGSEEGESSGHHPASEEGESSGRPPANIFKKPPGLFGSDSEPFIKHPQHHKKKSGGKKSKKTKKGGRKRKTKKVRRACL